jgi:hypothetical protein
MTAELTVETDSIAFTANHVARQALQLPLLVVTKQFGRRRWLGYNDFSQA